MFSDESLQVGVPDPGPALPAVGLPQVPTLHPVAGDPGPDPHLVSDLQDGEPRPGAGEPHPRGVDGDGVLRPNGSRVLEQPRLDLGDRQHPHRLAENPLFVPGPEVVRRDPTLPPTIPTMDRAPTERTRATGSHGMHGLMPLVPEWHASTPSPG